MEPKQKQAASIEAEHVSKLSCVGCQKVLDVSHLPSFVQIKCPECGAEQIVPAKFGSFLLIKQLGAGGMGVIYRAMDRELGRKVALKVMKRSLGDNPEFVQGFKHEAQAAAALNHRNVVQIYSFGQHNGQPYIAMELVDGGKLDNLITGAGLDELKALAIHLEVAEGLMAASDVGLVHGDVKPANILFGKNGEAKVVDFGLASYIGEQQQGGPVWGTPYYIAPEKARGKKADFRSDIYSLGATLFHVLTGKPPFDGRTPNDVVMARLNQPVPNILDLNPNIHPQTAKMVMRMLELDPAMRHPSYPALLMDMRNALAAARKPLNKQPRISIKIPVRVSEKKIKLWLKRVNLKKAAIITGSILLIMIIAGGWFGYSRHKARIKREAADRQLFDQSRAMGLASWNQIVKQKDLITEADNGMTLLLEKAGQLDPAIGQISAPINLLTDETDKVKEWLNETEDLCLEATVLANQLEAATASLTARDLSEQLENMVKKLNSIAELAQESRKTANGALANANTLQQEALNKINRDKTEQERKEALQQKAEQEKEADRKKEDEFNRMRPIIIQKELDALEKSRGANALLIAQRKFNEAERSFSSVQSKITLDETRAAFNNVMETYAELAKLKTWLIDAINRAPCKNCWMTGGRNSDVVRANGEASITIALGSAGITIVQWEAAAISQMLKMINYYLENMSLTEPQRAVILKQTALLCYESGVFKTAETYANAACKADPALLADLNRLMPGIVSAEK